MHELSLVTEILEQIGQDARKRGFDKVSVVNLLVGNKSGALPHALIFCFDLLKQETICAEAELLVETKTPVFVCKDCEQEYVADVPWYACELCGQPLPMCGGEELVMISYEGGE
jgi:hydrogenase nickel incorporation protein HypA/HybF